MVALPKGACDCEEKALLLDSHARAHWFNPSIAQQSRWFDLMLSTRALTGNRAAVIVPACACEPAAQITDAPS